MNQEIIALIQPYVETVVLAVIGLLATVVIAAIKRAEQKVKEWADANLSASTRALLHSIAEEAFAYAETALKEAGGQEKLNAATKYVDAKLSQLGLKVDMEDIRAAIEKAVVNYNAKVKLQSVSFVEMEQDELN